MTTNDMRFKSFTFEDLDLIATDAARQRESALDNIPTVLNHMIEQEEAKKRITMVQRQDEEFLKVAMKPSETPPEVTSVTTTMNLKRSSIFNIPSLHVNDNDSPIHSTSSLHEIAVTDKKSPKLQEQSTIVNDDSSQTQHELTIGQAPEQSLSFIKGGKAAKEVASTEPHNMLYEHSPRTQYIVSVDQLSSAAKKPTDFCIIPKQRPLVFLKPLMKQETSAIAPQPSKIETGLDKGSGVFDDYDEKELMEVPVDFGPPAAPRDPKLLSTENIVDYREIFAKCYRNARRKTRAVVENNPAITLGDLADNKTIKAANSKTWEPLVQEWFALASDVAAGILDDVNYENLIPVLFLGFEDVIMQAERRGLIPRDENSPQDDAFAFDDPDFDPLDALGIFLLKNNPRYNNSWETDPHVRSFRKVVGEIRTEDIQSQPLSSIANIAEQVQSSATCFTATARDGLSKPADEFRPAKSFLADGIWNGRNNFDERLTTDAQLKLQEILHLLISRSDDTAKVDSSFLRSCLLTYLEDMKNPEYDIRESIRHVITSQKEFCKDEPAISEAETAKILLRVIRMLQQTDLQPLLEHCKKFASQTKDSQRETSKVAEIDTLFDTLDAMKTGYISRPKIFNLLDDLYASMPVDTQKILRHPRLWPVSPIEELAVSSYSPSVPPGNTPTMLDMDDYKSLLSDETDSLLPIPEKVLQDASVPAPQVEHEYVQYMYAEYPSSGSNSLLPVPEADLPKSISVASRSSAEKALHTIDLTDDFAKKVFASCNESLAWKSHFSNRPKRMWSVDSAGYMDNVLTKGQFVAVLSNFLKQADGDVFKNTLTYLRQNYSETTDERILMLRQEKLMVRYERRIENFNTAFDCIDIDGKNLINCKRLIELWSKFTRLHITVVETEKVLKTYCAIIGVTTDVFSKEEFVDLCFILFDVYHVDIDTGSIVLLQQLGDSLKHEQAEKARGSIRKGWLDEFRKNISTCGDRFDVVFKNAIDLIEKDAEIHSQNKKLTVSTALLQHNMINAQRGRFLLRYNAASDSESSFLIGKTVLEDENNVGFTVVHNSKLVLVEKISGKVESITINPDRTLSKDGSFLYCPLLDRLGRCFGILVVDTLTSRDFQTFEVNEIEFYQGVAHVLAEGYLKLNENHLITAACAVALPWFHQRLSALREINLYSVEPDEERQSLALKKTLSTVSGGSSVIYLVPPVFRKGDPGFLDYLFNCAETSENIHAVIYEEQHMACPLRDINNFAALVLDLNSGQRVWSKSDEQEMINLLALLQRTYTETISSRVPKETSVPKDYFTLEIEQADNENRHEFIFARFLLVDLLQFFSQLEASTLSELRTITSPSKTFLQVVKAVLIVLYPVESEDGRFEQWSDCKDYVRLDLSQAMAEYSPTAVVSAKAVHIIKNELKVVAHLTEEDVSAEHRVLLYFYRWLMVCKFFVTAVDKMNTKSTDKVLSTSPVFFAMK